MPMLGSNLHLRTSSVKRIKVVKYVRVQLRQFYYEVSGATFTDTRLFQLAAMDFVDSSGAKIPYATTGVTMSAGGFSDAWLEAYSGGDPGRIANPNDNESAWRLFDGSDGTKFCHIGTNYGGSGSWNPGHSYSWGPGGWVQWHADGDNGIPVERVSGIRMVHGNDTDSSSGSRAPVSWSIYVSENGVNWLMVDSQDMRTDLPMSGGREFYRTYVDMSVLPKLSEDDCGGPPQQSVSKPAA